MYHVAHKMGLIDTAGCYSNKSVYHNTLLNKSVKCNNMIIPTATSGIQKN